MMPSRRFKWETPHPSCYKYNYGVGINFYQPMMDYIDGKDKGMHGGYPHLPWTDELGLSQYDPRTPIRSYSAEDLTKISRRTAARAQASLRDFKTTSKSSFQLNQSVSAASLTRQVQTEDRKKRKILQQIDKVKSRLMADDIDYDADADKRAEYSLQAIKRHLKGKSADGIAQQLLSESRRNIAETLDLDLQQRFSRTAHTRAHTRVITERMQKELEDSFVQPLEALSAELRGFDKRTAFCYFEKR